MSARPGTPKLRLFLDTNVVVSGLMVEAEVKRVLSLLAPGGGYIIGPDQGMPFPLENIAALWHAAGRWGRYPLEIV